MRSQSLVLVVVLCALVAGDGAADDLAKECSSAFDKVGTCLSYATGKAATPSKECCESVTKIKSSEPVCLCYIIQQTHNGSNQIKSMGIQEGKLLQLPTTCKLTNASVSDCPKLLHIPAGSPDAAIFTNTNATSTTLLGPQVPPTTTGGDNIGFKHVPNLAGLVTVTVAVFFCMFPTEIMFTRGG